MSKKCSVADCSNPAAVQVLLYDVYLDHAGDNVFWEQDYTCPFLCEDHMIENEKRAQGERRPRGVTEYPFTNKNQAQGITIYYPLSLSTLTPSLHSADI
jgi:hypothetical protein